MQKPTTSLSERFQTSISFASSVLLCWPVWLCVETWGSVVNRIKDRWTSGQFAKHVITIGATTTIISTTIDNLCPTLWMRPVLKKTAPIDCACQYNTARHPDPETHHLLPSCVLFSLKKSDRGSHWVANRHTHTLTHTHTHARAYRFS